MFERLIITIIQFIEFISNELKRAYYETYADNPTKEGEELSWLFTDEVERRRIINKDLFIRQAAINIGKKTLEEEGYIMPPLQALAIGEAMFNEAKSKGKIDFLNNAISEE